MTDENELTSTNGLKSNIKSNESTTSSTAVVQELRRALPQFFTKSGTFDKTKFDKCLEENMADELEHGYSLDFIGKSLARRQAGDSATTVLVPDAEHNEKPENKNSKNLFFTGDNLEVLRHLKNNYYASIDMIYIDPPYNTGSDGFVYADKFEYTDEELKKNFKMDDRQIKRLKTIQGRSSHSAWLTFMYPRLFLARQLLKDTGVIFISIDDNEQANLKLLMDEIFGGGNSLLISHGEDLTHNRTLALLRK